MVSAWKTLVPLKISPLGWTYSENENEVKVKAETLSNEQNSERANRFISASTLQGLAGEIQKTLNPSLSDHDMKPELRIIDFSPGYCHFSWKARTSASALSIDIYMLPGYDEATSWFAMRANPPNSTLPNGPLFKRPDGSDGTKRSLAGAPAGRGNVLHAVGNIVFEAHGLHKNEDLKPFEDIFFQLLSSEKSGPGGELGQLNVQCTNAPEKTGQDGSIQITVHQGEKLKFTAKAKNGFGLRCNLENYWVMVPLQLNPEVSKEDVTFEFLARSPGTEALEFVACDKWLDIEHMQRVVYKIEVQN
ncbi:hypothetical protein FRC10_004308 [Ceratobasidium sp. 414]|nr:hypothetical protein FRC10_004308 [Ceratobasidium sp. 414]